MEIQPTELLQTMAKKEDLSPATFYCLKAIKESRVAAIPHEQGGRSFVKVSLFSSYEELEEGLNRLADHHLLFEETFY